MGIINYDEGYSQNVLDAKGIIWKQLPDPAEIFEVARGSAVDVWLTLDPTKLQAKPDSTKQDNSFF